MKSSSLDEVLQKNPIAHIDTLGLMGMLFLAMAVGYFLAWFFRNKYNAVFLIRSYLIYGIIHLLLGILVFKVAIVIIIGSYLLGVVVTIFKSNRYFYE